MEESVVSEIDELYGAISDNDVERVDMLLAGDKKLANSADETPPPIHWAIYQDRWQIAEMLLDHGADLERRDRDRDATPLDYAIVYARKDIIPLLIARGANLAGKLELAEKGASGGFEEFGELPSREAYGEIVALLRRLTSGD